MQQNEAYKLPETISSRIDFFKELRLEGFVIEENRINYPLNKKPKKCLLDSTYVGEIVGDNKYLIVNTSHIYGSCRVCKRAISKLQRLAKEFGN